jgi:glycosyltransferase involved in cell wall biosynthesis
MRVSIVIPALNEEAGIGRVLKEVPHEQLNADGYEVEVLVIDNGSTDNTAEIARQHGARVIIQPIRGYGNAYKAGFANATGDFIATGDADLTYPFDELPGIFDKMRAEDLDFVTTDRLTTLDPSAMTRSHVWGNWLFSTTTKVLFRLPFNDSQSGMWIFKREIWPHLNVNAAGMPFSQELKIEAHMKGFRCAEVPITYRARVGAVKLSTYKDGIGNAVHLAKKRISSRKRRSVPVIQTTKATKTAAAPASTAK